MACDHFEIPLKDIHDNLDIASKIKCYLNR